MALFCCKRISALLRGIILKHDGGFYGLNCLHHIEQKIHLKSITVYVKIMIIVM